MQTQTSNTLRNAIMEAGCKDRPSMLAPGNYVQSQQAATRNRGKATVNTPQPIYDQDPSMVDEDDEMEKMLLCKQEEAKIQLNADQADWRDDTDDDELEDQKLEAHYITHPEQSNSVHDTYPIKQDAQNVSIESVDMNYDSKQIDQNDEDIDLAKEGELLA
nr:hypothetical protein [Tanacetum cinerariifolium]